MGTRIRYIMNWLFGTKPHPMVKPFQPLIDEYDMIRAHVEAVRPDLQFPFASEPAHEVGRFLDKNFPIPGGWGTQPVQGSARLLAQHYPKEK